MVEHCLDDFITMDPQEGSLAPGGGWKKKTAQAASINANCPGVKWAASSVASVGPSNAVCIVINKLRGKKKQFCSERATTPAATYHQLPDAVSALSRPRACPLTPHAPRALPPASGLLNH